MKNWGSLPEHWPLGRHPKQKKSQINSGLAQGAVLQRRAEMKKFELMPINSTSGLYRCALMEGCASTRLHLQHPDGKKIICLPTYAHEESTLLVCVASTVDQVKQGWWVFNSTHVHVRGVHGWLAEQTWSPLHFLAPGGRLLIDMCMQLQGAHKFGHPAFRFSVLERK